MKKLITLFLIGITISTKAQLCVDNTNSLYFDGVGSYVVMASSNLLEITDSITIEAWIKANGFAINPSNGTIVCKHGWNVGEEGYVLRAGGQGQLSFNICGDSLGFNASWKEVVSPTGAIQLNTWTHVACTFDGYYLKVYVNGVLSNSLAFTGKIYNPITYDLNIGRLADVNEFQTRYWKGNIDEVRIWHRALPQAELASHMQSHIDPATANALVGYWRINDGSGSTITDLQSSITGTITAATWSTDVPFAGNVDTPVISMIGTSMHSTALNGNQWYLNGVIINGATGYTYDPLQNGSYTITVTDFNGCSATSLPYIVNTIGINETTTENLFSSMSMSGRILRFNCSENLLSKATIKISDLNGRIVFERSEGKVKTEIDLSLLSTGAYMVNLSLNDSFLNKKILITN